MGGIGVWVDNTFILAADMQQWEFMTVALTRVLYDKYGWVWKPTSLEVLMQGSQEIGTHMQVHGTEQELSYKVVDRLEALGGVLCLKSPTRELLAHRFGKADKFYQRLNFYKKIIRQCGCLFVAIFAK